MVNSHLYIINRQATPKSRHGRYRSNTPLEHYNT